MTMPRREWNKPALRRLYRSERQRCFQQQHNLHIQIRHQVEREIHCRHHSGSLQGFVGLYWPLQGEADLRPLRDVFQHKLGLSTALPAADGDGSLQYHPWNDAPLAPDGCGIAAPLDQPALRPEQLALLLVPALAVDQHGMRLGYGGGYYDRLRCQTTWKQRLALVVVPEACVSPEPLPVNDWDQPFDGWITEMGCQLRRERSSGC